MKLSKLKAKPQLIKIELSDEEIVKEFGESLEFWTWDRQPMDVFLKLSSVDTENYSIVIDTVKDLILDEDGKPIIEGDETLPVGVLMKVIAKVVEGLGKS
jgi:hypothetical protein